MGKHAIARTSTAGVLVALVLSGCASLPDSGPVTSGFDDPIAQAPVEYVAEDPTPGAEPEEIVRGFMSGMSAGQRDDFAVARKYLDTPAQASWDPSTTVTIHASGVEPRIVAEAENSVTIEVPIAVTGVLDQDGVMIERSVDTDEVVTFELSRDDDGEWRILDLADGIVITMVTFGSQYGPFEVYFLSSDRAHLVPDVRYFPVRTGASSLLRTLERGPSAWLAAGVTSAVPAGVTLTLARISQGVAQVEISSEALNTSPEDRALLQAQVEQTLVQVTQIQSVELLVDGAELQILSQVPILTRDPLPSAPVMGVVDSGLVVVEAGTAVPTDVMVPPDTVALASSFDGLVVWALTDAGLWQLIPDDSITIPADGDSAGQQLIHPSIDRFDRVWTGVVNDTGSLLTVDSAGTILAVPAPDLAGREVLDLAVSRDGSRIAFIAGEAGQGQLYVAAIARDGDGIPQQIGQAVALAPNALGVDVVTWIDHATVAILGRHDNGAAVHRVTIGGRSEVQPSVLGGVDLIAGRGAGDFFVVTQDGSLLERTSVGYREVLAEVNLLFSAG